MKIVVTHLTRMRPGYICVAGLDIEGGDHVRPVDGGLTTRLLEREGGYFDLGNIVDLGSTQEVGAPPEVEDVRFRSSQARKVGGETHEDLWARMSEVASSSLEDIFGEELVRDGKTCAVDEGEGQASLGVMAPYGRTPPVLLVDEYDKVRLRLVSSMGYVNIAVSDLCLYEPDHVSPREERIGFVAERLARGVPSLFSIGLTRPFRERHWLQINNVWLAEDSGWRDVDRA